MSPSRSPAAHAIGLSGAAGAAVIGGKAKPWQTCDQRQPVDRFDVIIIGMGPGGEAAAGRLLQAGRRVAVAERELIGGESACIPSKTLLRAPEARAEAARAAGVATPALDWPELRDYRDYMVRHLDDIAQVRGYEQAGATVVAARLADRAASKRAGNCWRPTTSSSPPGRCRCARTSMAWAAPLGRGGATVPGC